MRRLAVLANAVLSPAPAPALAGPTFLTDDPEPTRLCDWKIYASPAEGEEAGRTYEGSLRAVANYGGKAKGEIYLL